MKVMTQSEVEQVSGGFFLFSLLAADLAIKSLIFKSIFCCPSTPTTPPTTPPTGEV